jgi:hypothetical protein
MNFALPLAYILLFALVSFARCDVHPAVFFPGYGFSVFDVTVSNQTDLPECPSSGTYSLYYQAPSTQGPFDLVCMTRLLALTYDNNTGSFSPRNGVSVMLAKYGHPDCAPYYSTLFEALRGQGLVYNQTLLAACYDWRMTPDTNVITNSDFMEDTRALVERAYNSAGGLKVFLFGHSNGPIMAQYFLIHVEADWRETYIGEKFRKG